MPDASAVSRAACISLTGRSSVETDVVSAGTVPAVPAEVCSPLRSLRLTAMAVYGDGPHMAARRCHGGAGEACAPLNCSCPESLPRHPPGCDAIHQASRQDRSACTVRCRTGATSRSGTIQPTSRMSGTVRIFSYLPCSNVVQMAQQASSKSTSWSVCSARLSAAENCRKRIVKRCRPPLTSA
jgi:hypothetical protein